MEHGTLGSAPPELPRPIEPPDLRDRIEEVARTALDKARSAARAASPSTTALVAGSVISLLFVGVLVTVVVRGRTASTASDVEATLPRAEVGDLTLPTARPVPLVVHVSGAVGRPNVYQLDAGARIADAIDAAGGATPEADLERVNLAAVIADGQRVFVPRRDEPIPAVVTGAGPPSETAQSGPININEATIDQLDELPGVGPATAQAIVAYREQHGSFAAVAELLEVPGIGPAKLLQIEDLVVAG